MKNKSLIIKIILFLCFIFIWNNITNWFEIDQKALNLIQENHIDNETYYWWPQNYKKIDYVKFILARELCSNWNSILLYNTPENKKEFYDRNFWDENLYIKLDYSLYFLKNIEKTILPSYIKINWTSINNMIINESHWTYQVLKELILKIHNRFNFYHKHHKINLKSKYYIFFNQIDLEQLDNDKIIEKELWIRNLFMNFAFNKKIYEKFEKKIDDNISNWTIKAVKIFHDKKNFHLTPKTINELVGWN